MRRLWVIEAKTDPDPEWYPLTDEIRRSRKNAYSRMSFLKKARTLGGKTTYRLKQYCPKKEAARS